MMRLQLIGSIAALAMALPGCHDASSGEIFAISGQVLDWDGAPVGDAQVTVQVGSFPISGTVHTDTDGRYTVADVAVAEVMEALREREELTVVVQSPSTDLPPFGTVEGDWVGVLPLSLGPHLRPDDIAPDAAIEAPVAWVPLQGKGYPITDELRERGGELSWVVPDGMGGQLEVALVIAPGSIHVEGDGASDEITLTVLDAERAPMAIPNDGYGALWTIQPRDIVFEPAARLRLRGNRMALVGLVSPEPGSRFEIFGASLELGWTSFGEVELVDAATPGNGPIVLESPEGIITRGAWGHVFSSPETDAGVLVTCTSSVDRAPIACAVLDDSRRPWGMLNRFQYDYNNQHYNVYFTDIEPVCAGCTNNGHPESQLAVGLRCGGTCTGRVRALAMCPNELALTNPSARIHAMRTRQLLPQGVELDDIDPVQDPTYGITATPEFTVFHRNFSYAANVIVTPPTNCQ